MVADGRTKKSCFACQSDHMFPSKSIPASLLSPIRPHGLLPCESSHAKSPRENGKDGIWGVDGCTHCSHCCAKSHSVSWCLMREVICLTS